MVCLSTERDLRVSDLKRKISWEADALHRLHLFVGRLGLPLFVVLILSFSEATMAANGEGSEKASEHPSAMSLFAPATQAAVSFHGHVMCLFFLLFEPGVSYVGLGTVSTWSSSPDLAFDRRVKCR